MLLLTSACGADPSELRTAGSLGEGEREAQEAMTQVWETPILYPPQPAAPGRAQDILSNTKGDLNYTMSQPQEQPAAAAKVPSGDGVAFTACQMFPILISRGFDLM